MKSRKLEKVVLFLFFSLLVTAVTFLTVLFRQTQREHATIDARQAFYEQRVAEAETKLKEKEDRLRRIHYDPPFIERTIRQRLGYVKPEEILIRFEAPDDVR